ncbi:MAG: hypothetical protein RL477_1218, partial [Pseudomonadota bacterium]
MTGFIGASQGASLDAPLARGVFLRLCR